MYGSSYADAPKSERLKNAANHLCKTVMEEVYNGNYTHSKSVDDMIFICVEDIQVVLLKNRVVIGTTISYNPDDMDKYSKLYNTLKN